MAKYKRYVSTQEFLSRLEQTPRRWKNVGSYMRLDECLCPIAAVFGGVDLDREGNEGLSDENKRRIMHAADKWNHNRCCLNGAALRLSLQRACGLKPPASGYDPDEDFEDDEDLAEDFEVEDEEN